METLQHTLGNLVIPVEHKKNIVQKFLAWCESQNENRIAWLAIALAGHGCVITPITMFFIMMAGNNFVYWPLAMGAMTMCVIVNLAAMPTKITIPLFVLSLVIDLVIIANCVAAGLSLV